MECKEKDCQVIGQPDFLRVTPVEAPLENYLVVESLQRMPNIFARGLTYLIVLILIVALAYSLVSKIDIIVECRSVARPASQKLRVLSEWNGYVKKICVSEWQTVEKGDPLFLIRSKGTGSYETTADGLQEKDKTVRAESAGTVSELYVRNTGEYVRVSDLLCTIFPSDTRFYMDIEVANKDIGLVEKDMFIKYKLDAFPYADYGTLHGRVVAISPSAVEDEVQGFIYHVRGSFDKTCFEIKEKRYFIRDGMTATAELATEEKSIFSVLLGKLRQ